MSTVAKINTNVSKIDTSKGYQGEKGLYVKLEVWINDVYDKHGNNCSIAQVYESEGKVSKIYIGNGRAYYVEAKKGSNVQQLSDANSNQQF